MKRRLNGAAPERREAPEYLFYGYLLLMLLEFSGLPNQFPVLRVIRFTTILSYSLFLITLVKVGMPNVFKHRQAKLLMFFLVFTILSMIWAVVRLRAYQSIRPFVDYLILMYLTLSLVDRKRRFELLSWTLTGVATYLVIRNLHRLGQETRMGAFAAPYFMGDGNDFAWGIAVMLPFALYLVLIKKTFVARSIAMVGVAICILGIVGTGSRGGSLGLAAAVLFYWWFMSRSRAKGAAVLIVGLIGVLVFAPASYLGRMQSLSNTAEDTSAQARLTTWSTAIDMAFDFPLGVGAGNFSSAYGRFYLGGGRQDNMGYAAHRWFSAHSIYFRTLGEYGFLGLALLIWLILANVADNFRLRKRLEKADEGPVPSEWPSVLCMAVIAYAVCGIFLGGLTYPYVFFLSGLTIAAKNLVSPAERATERAGPLRRKHAAALR